LPKVARRRPPVTTRIGARRPSLSKTDRKNLSAEEIDRQSAERLPDREAMSLIDANVAAPINAAAALNVLSDDSTADANAEQSSDITEST
jgi:hypothetical protein